MYSRIRIRALPTLLVRKDRHFVTLIGPVAVEPWPGAWGYHVMVVVGDTVAKPPATQVPTR